MGGLQVSRKPAHTAGKAVYMGTCSKVAIRSPKPIAVGSIPYCPCQQSIGCGLVNSVQKRWNPLAAGKDRQYAGVAQWQSGGMSGRDTLTIHWLWKQSLVSNARSIQWRWFESNRPHRCLIPISGGGQIRERSPTLRQEWHANSVGNDDESGKDDKRRR